MLQGIAMAFSVYQVGEETRVSQFPTHDKQNPTITSLPDGWVVTWSSLGQDGSGSGIYMQKYNLQGQPQFPEDRLVNSGSTAGDQKWSKVTALENDAGFVVTWIESNADGSQRNVFHQRYNLDGEAQEPALQVNGTQNVSNVQHLSINALPDGGWLTTWSAAGAHIVRHAKGPENIRAFSF
jgi:hypothetical protein